MQVKTSKVTLNYNCDLCGAGATQPLDQIVECGTLICHSCDCDMSLDDTVEIDE